MDSTISVANVDVSSASSPGTSGDPPPRKSSPQIRSQWLAYCLAVLSVTLAALLTQSIVAVSGRTVFALFYAAILVSAWYGGLGPGLLAAILAALAGNYLFLNSAQIQMPDLAGGVQVGVFLLVALFISSLAGLHRKTEQDNHRQRQLLAGLVSNAPAAIAILRGPEYRYVMANPAYCQLAGCQGEVTGHTVAETWPEEASSILSILDSVYHTGEPYHAPDSAYPVERDGQWEELLFSYSYIRLDDEQGQPEGILILGRDITERKQVEQALRESEERLTSSLQEREKLLREKEVLIKEVYHRVRNNLQGVSNLIYLQATYLKDERVRAMFRQTQDRLKSIALIHEKLYQSEDLVQLDFAEYIRSLAEYLIHSYRTRPELIKLDVKVDDMRLNVDTAIPVGIIVNELVSNSLRHAFPSDEQPGEIQIELRQLTPGEATLRVKDNGHGLPDEVDITSSSSLGLRLVNMLAGYMQGQVEIVRNNGTLFEVRLRVLDA